MSKTLEEQLKELQESHTKLAAEAKAAKEENAALRETVKAEDVAKIVKGAAELVKKTTDGKSQKLTVKFKTGYAKTHVYDNARSWNEAVGSEGLLALANGKLTDEQKAESPLLGRMTADDAKAYLGHLVEIQYAGLDITVAA